MGFDPAARVVFLVARMTDDESTTAFGLRLVGVSELRIDLPTDALREQTEITDASAVTTPTGSVVSLVFWDGPSGLTARCADYSVEA